ncbi:MAG: formate dehydrogenase subunit gamma [Campylobacter sp.]|nr:formate dehydrogenase subunit gamma [Campylobacter sp.]
MFCACFASADKFKDLVQYNSPVWGEGRVTNIPSYYDGFAPFFVNWQANGYFSWLTAGAIVAVIVAFVGHYAIVGPKSFSHNHGKIYAFSTFERIVHLVAAVAWVVLVPTGIIIMFGETFGGGFFVRVCKNLHGLATIAFAIVVLPMFFSWFVRMLPAVYDIKWAMMVGGYLSKKKHPIPAGKFNAGQKAWFWVATLGGMVMIATGASMFFLDYNIPAMREILGLSQIEILRLSAIIHNILGAACAVFLLVHIYMAVFCIKGSIHAVITGYKEEEEVYILHHYWYQELVKKGKIQKSIFEKEYTNLA